MGFKDFFFRPRDSRKKPVKSINLSKNMKTLIKINVPFFGSDSFP